MSISRIKLEEYRHPQQIGRVLTGHRLYTLLEEEGRLPRAISYLGLIGLRSWGSEKLREEFKAPTLTAWGSVTHSGDDGMMVPVLLVFQDDLPINWYPLTGGWSDNNPGVFFA